MKKKKKKTLRAAAYTDGNQPLPWFKAHSLWRPGEDNYRPRGMWTLWWGLFLGCSVQLNWSGTSAEPSFPTWLGSVLTKMRERSLSHEVRRLSTAEEMKHGHHCSFPLNPIFLLEKEVPAVWGSIKGRHTKWLAAGCQSTPLMVASCRFRGRPIGTVSSR